MPARIDGIPDFEAMGIPVPGSQEARQQGCQCRFTT